MKPWVWAVLLCAGTVSARAGEDTLRLPESRAGVVTRGGDRAVVHYPFGRVELPLEKPVDPVDPPTVPGRLHAQTHARFTLSYELVKDGDVIRARRVKVRVANREEYRSPPTARLREHEAVHRRINDSAAPRMERALSAFRAERVTPSQAEQQLKTRFQEEVAAVKALHAEWDETDVFLSTGPAHGPG